MFNKWRINKSVKDQKAKPVTGKLNSENIKNILGDSDDVIIKDVYINNEKTFKVKAIGIDGLVDSQIVDAYILKPLALDEIYKQVRSEQELYNYIMQGSIYHIAQSSIDNVEEVIEEILNGQTVIVFDSIEKAISFDAKSLPNRSIQEAESESVMKGAKDSFIESIRTNTALVRRKIKEPSLRFKSFQLGKNTKTPVNIVYLEGIADQDIIDKLVNRIENLDINDLITPGNFEENIRENRFSLFPEVEYTERVDKFCANLVDGKVGVLIDGVPIAYIVPGLFAMLFQAPEDYSQKYIVASFTRIIRYFCAFITVLIPGFYVAITSFHQEMIPTDLAISIIKSKEGVPFTTAIEVFGMLLAFEILLEASLRLPKAIGATISIIGGLVIGEAAVSAKFISPAVVVIVAIAGIAGFVIPNQSLSNALRMCRFFLLFCGVFGGLVGISMGFTLLIYYLCTLESFGVPYMTPYASNNGSGMIEDTIVRKFSDSEE